MLLTTIEVAKYALAIGSIFEASCDEPNCGKLIKAGDLSVVLKWKKRDDKITFLGRIPVKHRCMACQLEKTPIKEVVKVAGAGRTSKKVSQEVAAGLIVNPVVRRTVLSLLKKETSIMQSDLLAKLRKRKAIRELKKTEVSATLRSMRKLKIVKVKAKAWTIPVQKAKKPVKARGKKRQKVVAKR